jgi:hypothetical protein
LLACLAAGALAGFVAGGIGGRLAMLLLRLTSPGSVIGLESDDGFEIGLVSTRTIPFVLVMTAIGGVFGVLYAIARHGVPARLRLPAWTLFGAAVGGAAIVHDDGVDFAVLEPALLAILLFVAIPAVAAVVIVLLAERWSATEPWSSRRLTAGLLAAAAASTFALVPAVVLALVAFSLGRSGAVAALVRRAGRILVPVALAAASVFAGVDLVSESSRILR